MSDRRPMDADELLRALQLGLAHHQAGRLTEATQVYTGILRTNPEQPETLDLYGVLLHQTSNNRDAVEVLDKAARLKPGSASILNHLGAAQRDLGDMDAAIRSFTSAAGLQRDLHEARYNLAVTLGQLGRHEEAARAAREAVFLAPENPEYRLALAVSLSRQGRDAEAVEMLREAIDLAGPLPRYLLPLGRSLIKLGRDAEARLAVKRAIAVQPGEIGGYGVLASLEAGLDPARWSVTTAPGDGVNWSLYASKLCERLDDANAMAAARKSMILRPDHISAYLTLSDSVNRNFLFREALDTARRGLAIDPNAHQLALWAGFGELLLGDVAKGWKLYRRRRLQPGELTRRALPPDWEEDAPPGGPLLVCAEQGLGDEYLFLSCLPDLLEVTRNVLVECDPRNLALFERSFPGIRFFPRTIIGQDSGGAVWDYRTVVEAHRPIRHILAADLMQRFGVGMGRRAPDHGYIRADPEERKRWSTWLGALGDKPKVGLSWRSGNVDAVRGAFYFSLEELIDALGLEAACYVSAVYIDATDEIRALAHARRIMVHEPPNLDQRNELDRVAALLSELDFVVSVDNAVAAIAAACGVPTIMLERGTFQIAGEGDPLFGNVHPSLEGAKSFNRDEVLANAGDILGRLLNDARVSAMPGQSE